MTPVYAALSHYWHLRSQDVSPEAARAHVRQRFGVEVDTEQPMASTSEVVESEPFGKDITRTEVCVTSNPQGLHGTADG